MAPKVVISNWVHQEVIDFLAGHCEVEANKTREPLCYADLVERSQDAEALMAFMTDKVDAAFLDRCPKLRVIACALKGYDNFDEAACTDRGVWLTIVPDLLTAPTAELTVGLMIAVARHMREGDALLRSNRSAGWRPRLYGRSLDESTVGLVGAGDVGKAIARRLSGFKCQLLYHDECRLQPDKEDELGLRRAPLTTLLSESHFIVLALPLTRRTFHLVDGAFLKRVRRGSYLVNPARGSLVDESAVAQALEEGLLAGYAADVFEMEDWARQDRPGVIPQRLLASDKTIFTPHLGSAIDSARMEIAMEAAESIVQCLKGDRPKGAVNAPRQHREG